MTNAQSGALALPEEAGARFLIACFVAGALAEAGIVELQVVDPRACRGRAIVARESDLPAELAACVPGTTYNGRGVALLVDQSAVRWVAEPGLARALVSIGTR